MSFVNRGMSWSECDGDPRACCHGNRERQHDTLVPGISEEEERQRPHPTLVLFSSCCSHSCASSLPSVPLSPCTRARSVSDRKDGHKENEDVWELHSSFPPAKVSSVRGDGGRGVPAEDSQCDKDGAGLLQLQGSGDPQTQKHMEGIVQWYQHHTDDR